MTQWSSVTGGIASSLLPQQPAALALPRALLFGVALVVKLLAAGQGQLDLGTALFVKIELERHQRHAFTLDRAEQFVDLPAMQQEFPRPLRRVVEAVRLLIFGYVRVDEPDLAVAR